MKADSVFSCFFSVFKSDLISRVLSEYLAVLPVKTRCTQGGGVELAPNASLSSPFLKLFFKKPQHPQKKQVKRGQLDSHFSPRW